MAKVRVRYKGLSDVREITAKQLKPLGIGVSDDLVFHRGNNFALNIDANDELIDILKREGTFTVSKIEDDNTIGDDIIKATMRDDTAVAAVAVNTETGQKSSKK